MVDASGQIVSQSRYLPFGELLWEDGASPTDYTYTGQRSLSDIGLMDYNARLYDPLLGRFTSPDSIVPGIYSNISWNMYAYVSNNPLRFIDPTGHNQDCAVGDPYCENLKPRMADPSLECTKNEHCNAAYKTIVELSSMFRRRLTGEEIIGMTATGEYYSEIDQSDQLRKDAQEALARNIYTQSRDDPHDYTQEGKPYETMSDDRIYWFLSGYEPYWRVFETPSRRATQLITKSNNNEYVDELIEDVKKILNYKQAQEEGWTTGSSFTRPWQWINKTYPPATTGYDYNNGAILCINLGGENNYGGDYFWLVTARQDYCGKFPDQEVCQKEKVGD